MKYFVTAMFLLVYAGVAMATGCAYVEKKLNDELVAPSADKVADVLVKYCDLTSDEERAKFRAAINDAWGGTIEVTCP